MLISLSATNIVNSMFLSLVYKVSHRVIHMFFEKLSVHFYTANSATENRRDYENNKSL